jgi:PII-like signaling protein
MPETIKAGTILINDGTLLPDALRFETEPCAPGWRLVRNLDGYGLDRKIHEAGWTFFCLAGETKVTVFGIDGEKMVRRAVKQILATLKSQFNSLEITRVASVASKRFLGVRYVTVSAQSRHIQESLFLLGAKDRQELVPSRIDSRPDQSIGLARGKELRQEEIIAERSVATILNL